ncbi:MAG: WbqC family protein, partial [Bacteroidota bacterium]
ELHYLPNLQYFSKLIHHDQVCLEQWENYRKGSYRNRCYIAGANGPLRLSIPLKKGKNEQQSIREVQIAYEEPWASHHWTSIRSAYGNAPFFDHYAEQLQPIFAKQWTYLFDFNWQLLEAICSIIGIAIDKLQTTSTYDKTVPSPLLDFRNGIHPKAHLRKADPHFENKKYPQVFEEKTGFLPNLSILDLLFCTGPQTLLLLESMIVGDSKV